MKKLFFFTIGVFLILISYSQSITGNWEGTLNANGTELPVVFHIAKDSTGKLVGLMDSPKQMAYGLKCTSIFVNGDSVILEMKSFGGKFKGIVSSDNKTLTGNWFQGGASLPLDLKKTNDVATIKEIKRPQTPKPPFVYFSDEVSYSNADKSVTFGGTFTYPMNKVLKKYPTVILITGSGQQDRDETILQHKPFAVIADYLTKKGMALLRVDDRGIGKTTGNFRTSTTADFAQDVETSLAYLKTRKEVDTNKIGLIGHSEGGMIAPMVAGRRKEIKFIVLLAGPGVAIKELMVQQNIDVLTAAGISKNEAGLYGSLFKNLLATVLPEKDTAIAMKNATAVFTNWQKSITENVVKNTTGVTDEKSKTQFITAFVNQVNQPWFNYFIKFNPADYLSKIHCAVLALNGQKDIQVAAVPNLTAIDKILTAGKVQNFTTQSIPGLNHLFQHCKSCTVQEYAELEETFAPEVLQLMSDWIKGIVK